MQFSERQLQQVLTVISGILEGVMNAGDSGVMGRAREITAVTQYIGKAGELFSNNDLVSQLIQAIGTGSSTGSNLVGQGAFKNPSDLLVAIGDIDNMLPQDETGYGVRQFIYGMAETIAGASGGGLFGSGQKISHEEADFLDFLRGKLGL